MAEPELPPEAFTAGLEIDDDRVFRGFDQDIPTDDAEMVDAVGQEDFLADALEVCPEEGAQRTGTPDQVGRNLTPVVAHDFHDKGLAPVRGNVHAVNRDKEFAEFLRAGRDDLPVVGPFVIQKISDAVFRRDDEIGVRLSALETAPGHEDLGAEFGVVFNGEYLAPAAFDELWSEFPHAWLSFEVFSSFPCQSSMVFALPIHEKRATVLNCSLLKAWD